MQYSDLNGITKHLFFNKCYPLWYCCCLPLILLLLLITQLPPLLLSYLDSFSSHILNLSYLMPTRLGWS